MDKELQAVVEQALAGVEKPFATFDFDGTCIANDVAEATLAHLCKNKLLKNMALLGENIGESATYHARVLQRYYELLETGGMFDAYLFAACAFAGFTLNEAETHVSAAIDAEGEILEQAELYGVSIAHGLAARQAVKELAQSLREKGVAIWTISASPEVAVRVAMKRFGYEGELVGLRNKVVDGILTDVIEEPYSIKDGKVECIKKYINPTKRPILAIGDSSNDQPMIEYAQIPVVVDKGNSLAKLARERGWRLISQ